MKFSFLSTVDLRMVIVISQNMSEK